MLKFYLLTDTHLWSVGRLGLNGRSDQVCINESEAILDSCFNTLSERNDSDIILIAGDLTNNGERANHEEMIKKLRALKEKGKRVYVITATHDYGLVLLDDDGNNLSTGGVPRRELRQMYDEFGFSDAIAVDEQSMSYVVQLADGYRLMALNDDGNGRSFCGYYEHQMNWIIEQLNKAKADGQFIFAMNHHPILPPFPLYPMASKRDMLGEYEKTAQILADNGLRYIFTGHTHCHNIDYVDTPSGNRLYDINTGSLMGYPAPFRSVVIDDKAVNITTEHVETFDYDTKGMSHEDYLKYVFDRFFNKLLDSMENDPDEFCSTCVGIGVDRKVMESIKRFIPRIGKYINSLDFAKVGSLLHCKNAVSEEIEGRLMRDFITEAIRNIWSGEEKYSLSTPEGAAFYAFAKKLSPLLSPFAAKIGIDDVPAFALSLIYDETPDIDAVLPLK